MTLLGPRQTKSTQAEPSTARPIRGARSAVPATTPFGVPLQPKLTVGPAHDRFEAEADHAADHVLGGRAGAPAVTPLGSPPAQRQSTTEEEEGLQRQVAAQDEEALQRESAGPGPPATAPAVESGVRSARGGGAPLPQTTRQRMEQGFGRDFSAVRVHDDARANRMNAALNARAFTTGSDIFFARGAYGPESAAGDRLLAHELTHVAQQTGPGRVQPRTIQRDGPDQPETEEEERPRTWQDSSNSKRGIDLEGSGGKTLYRLPQLKVPTIGHKRKGVTARGSITGGFAPNRGGGAANFVPGSGVFHWTGKGERSTVDPDVESQTDNSTQVQIWERYVRDNGDLAGGIRDKFETTNPKISRGGEGGPRIYYLRNKKNADNVFNPIGTAEELARSRAILRPPFDKSRNFTLMEVDHYVEIQLGGAHDIGNMWLLDRDANGKSGREIKANVTKNVNDLVNDAGRSGFWGDGNPSKPSYRSWPDDANIDFARVRGYSMRGAFWDKSEIVAGEQLDRLRPLRASEMAAMGFNFDPNVTPEAITIFLSQNSPYRRIMRVSQGELSYRGRRRRDEFISGFDLQSATYQQPSEIVEGQEVATLTGRAFGKRTVPLPGGGRSDAIAVEKVLNVPVLSKLDAGFGGYIDRGYIDTELRSVAAAELAGASSLSFQSAGLTENWELMAQGSVRSDVPLFRGFEFSLRAVGNAIYLEADIPTERLQFDPFHVTEASLSLGYDENGILYGGQAAFEIDGVGSGTVTADEQELSGAFAFDIDAFDPAEVEVTYRDGLWSGAATLGLKEGTIPYVTGGSIAVTLDENGLGVDGTAQLSGPGVPEGTEIAIRYDPKTQVLTFGGQLPLDTSRFPGVTDARVSLLVTRTADGSYSVAGSGSAAFELSGISGDLDVAYRDGLVRVDGTAAVSRPPMSGEAEFHLSNQAMDAAGQPIEGPPLAEFRVWGAGSASIQFGEYITGTVGIAFLENGEVEMLGTISLPPSIQLVEATPYDYDILDIPRVEFPIIGLTIPVIGRSFGVFGFVRGGVDAKFTVGPAELVDSEVTVSYNPDHPEDMSISGGSTFQVGADAEIGLSVTGGIGAGLGIVEATGEIGIRGALGFALTGGGSVLIAWTPIDGLEIDATVFGEAQPQFSISLIAEAEVVVDAFLWSGTLWNRDWERELASFGPNMLWRVELPAAWSEEDGLDVDLDHLVLTQPDINVKALAGDIFDAVV